MEKKPRDESFIVGDYKPVTFREFANFTAEQIGANHPKSVHYFLQIQFWGEIW